jgi:hypothetical protein
VSARKFRERGIYKQAAVDPLVRARPAIVKTEEARENHAPFSAGSRSIWSCCFERFPDCDRIWTRPNDQGVVMVLLIVTAP